MAWKQLTPEQIEAKNALKAALPPLPEEVLQALGQVAVSIPDENYANRDYGRTTFNVDFDIPKKDGGKMSVTFCVRDYSAKTRKRSIVDLGI